jgi:hypothetical protein
MYEFVLNMWVMKRVTEAKVQTYVAKEFITQAEANMIIATPQQ